MAQRQSVSRIKEALAPRPALCRTSACRWPQVPPPASGHSGRLLQIPSPKSRLFPCRKCLVDYTSTLSAMRGVFLFLSKNQSLDVRTHTMRLALGRGWAGVGRSRCSIRKLCQPGCS